MNLNYKFTVRNADELEALQHFVDLDLAGRDHEPYTLLDMIEQAGVDPDIELTMQEGVAVGNGSLNLLHGLRLNAALPVTGVDVNGKAVRVYFDASNWATKNIKIFILQLTTYVGGAE